MYNVFINDLNASPAHYYLDLHMQIVWFLFVFGFFFFFFIFILFISCLFHYWACLQNVSRFSLSKRFQKLSMIVKTNECKRLIVLVGNESY